MMFDGFDTESVSQPEISSQPIVGVESSLVVEPTATLETVASYQPRLEWSTEDSPTANSLNATHASVEFSNDRADVCPEPVSGDLILVVDAHNLIYQVFHAVAALTSPKGLPVGAVHGFLRDIVTLRQKWNPKFLLVAFDLSGETFRNQLYSEYKANREGMPEELRPQLPIIREALSAIGIPILEMEGFEADDILATVATYAEAVQARCLLVTSDKDCRQLLSENVQMFNIRKDEIFGAAELAGVWGVRPDQVVDFQALVGDSSDNVPGVPGIGPKFAQQLLEQFQTLDAVLDKAEQVKGQKRQENLKTFREQAFLSRELVALRRDVPIQLTWAEWKQLRPDRDKIENMLNELGFRRLAEQLLQGSTTEVTQVRESPQTLSRNDYRLIDTSDKLADLVELLSDAKQISLDTETTGTNARQADPVGYSFSWAPGHAAYIPLRAPSGEKVMPLDEVNETLRPILESRSIGKIGQNIKYDLVIFRGQGIDVQGVVFDSMVADYLLDSGQRSHGLGELAKKLLNLETIPITELIGSGAKQIRMDQVPVSRVCEYACEDADLPLRLLDVLEPRLRAEGVYEILTTLEIPLIEVLAELEFNGIRVDVERLKELSGQFAVTIERLFHEIMELAGHEFNPDSPKQLAKILFDELKLPVVKKTKTGPSTDVDVLMELASQHPLPAKIIEYRQASKLKGTYVDALQSLVSSKSGRVHTSFRQDAAITGRLSSNEPNLQNIPIRTEDGRKIRSAFVPGQAGWLLLAADYSQIELRVLAHVCGDVSLRTAFEADQDIHARVASEVYGVPLDEVTSAMRRSAKAVNFGIIYGQSPFGLAKGLNISKDEASEFIDNYFARYSGVQSFIADTLRTCRAQGYVSTMLGRKRWIKGVRDFDSMEASKRKILIEPERMAVNTIIQGTAADIIKKAMIDVHRSLRESDLQAKMLLQIHDELLFEVADSDVEALAAMVRDKMTNVVKLAVPLKVDVKVGKSWADCEPI